MDPDEWWMGRRERAHRQAILEEETADEIYFSYLSTKRKGRSPAARRNTGSVRRSIGNAVGAG
jgi:hypothetical protein